MKDGKYKEIMEGLGMPQSRSLKLALEQVANETAQEVHKENEFYKSFYDENRISILQYESLRKNFQKMVNTILGENYYNMAMDTYESDKECCEDIIRKLKKPSRIHRYLQQFKDY